jgi:aspartyl-tRNA(Asn)/glutamyl-tRNA(Gln) amidotransferase subunit B
LRGEVPESPGARVRRLAEELDFEVAYALVTTERDRLYSGLTSHGIDSRLAANWVMNDFAATGQDPNDVNIVEAAWLLDGAASLTRDALRAATAKTASSGFRAADYLSQTAVSDVSELAPVIDAVIAANPAQVETYRGGKEGVLGFLVGQVMKETQGKADPKVVNALLREKLRQ